MTLTDQHGRKWFANIEKASGGPCGVVQQMFDVPYPALVAPQKYLTFPVDQPGRVVIDYDAWYGDQKARETEWENQRLDTVANLPGGAQNPLLPRLLGPRPMSSKVVKAMQQGNAWALGFSEVRPKEADDYFPPPLTPSDEPVFSGERVFADEPQPVGGVDLKTIMAEIERDIPASVQGAARQSRIVKELKRRTEVAHAG